MTGVDLCQLPEDCIATVFSFTSPKNTGQCSIVSSGFKSVSESDAVWRRFLPSDYQTLISQSSNPSLLSSCASAKDLYLSLSDNPIIIDNGKKSFRLDKLSGKKSFMLSARDLMIIWGDTPRYWRWSNSRNNSRFAEVAELIAVCWLEIRGKIKATMLSPETHYTAYLVYKTTVTTYGFDNPVEVNVGISGAEEGDSSKRSLYLDAGRERRPRNPIIVRRVGLFRHRHAMANQPLAPRMENDNDDDDDGRNNVNNNDNVIVRRVRLFGHRYPMAMQPLAPTIENDNNNDNDDDDDDNDNDDDDDDRNNVNNNENGGHHNNHTHPLERQDGWLEIELGDYFNREDEVGDLEISILEVNRGDWKGGLVIQGIDIRPKSV
ncbi:F-box protein At2g02240-like [Euphorbia lathyris]|uniref:F-box protein At2g02240-like n=1 Tax=Euphorbia lathyris TaxID=212925 RepID=UPI0033137655